MPHQEHLVRRALTAYMRAAFAHGVYYPPRPTAATVVEHAGRHYVVLVNDVGVLAVYRIKNNGLLQRRYRWPQALEEALGDALYGPSWRQYDSP